MYWIVYNSLTIKNAMSQIWAELDGYHSYYSCHFMSNFNKKFKDVALKKLLDKMCQQHSRHKFDTMYDDIVNWNDQIK
jgi:hypothetical protein